MKDNLNDELVGCLKTFRIMVIIFIIVAILAGIFSLL